METLFWFHPPIWWLGRRLDLERERACDEAVVSGFAPDVTPRPWSRRPVPSGSAADVRGGARGAFSLTSRVAQILGRRAGAPSPPRAVLLPGLGARAGRVAPVRRPPCRRGRGDGAQPGFKAPRFWSRGRRAALPPPSRTMRGSGQLGIEPSSPGPVGSRPLPAADWPDGVQPQLVRIAYGPFNDLPVYAVVGLPEWAPASASTSAREPSTTSSTTRRASRAI